MKLSSGIVSIHHQTFQILPIQIVKLLFLFQISYVKFNVDDTS